MAYQKVVNHWILKEVVWHCTRLLILHTPSGHLRTSKQTQAWPLGYPWPRTSLRTPTPLSAFLMIAFSPIRLFASLEWLYSQKIACLGSTLSKERPSPLSSCVDHGQWEWTVVGHVCQHRYVCVPVLHLMAGCLKRYASPFPSFGCSPLILEIAVQRVEASQRRNSYSIIIRGPSGAESQLECFGHLLFQFIDACNGHSASGADLNAHNPLLFSGANIWPHHVEDLQIIELLSGFFRLSCNTASRVESFANSQGTLLPEAWQ